MATGIRMSHPLTGIDVYAHMSSSLYPGYSGLYGPRLATIYGTGLGIYRVLVHVSILVSMCILYESGVSSCPWVCICLCLAGGESGCHACSTG
jgi:hypothetical protein